MAWAPVAPPQLEHRNPIEGTQIHTTLLIQAHAIGVTGVHIGNLPFVAEMATIDSDVNHADPM